MSVRSRPLSALDSHRSVGCQAGTFLRFEDFSVEICGELRSTCLPVLHSSGCFSRGETVSPLCCVSSGSVSLHCYLPALTCTRVPEQDPLCVLCGTLSTARPDRPGIPCHFTFHPPAHRNLTFAWNQEVSLNTRHSLSVSGGQEHQMLASHHCSSFMLKKRERKEMGIQNRAIKFITLLGMHHNNWA